MSNRLYVYLDDRRIGTAHQENGPCEFTYDEQYRLEPNAIPLSLSMPLTTATHKDAIVAPFLDNLLPDNADVRNRWGREFQVSPRNPFALVRNIGEDLPGAVRFASEEGRSGHDEIEWLDEGAIAEHIRALRRDPTAWLFPGSAGRFSLAGAQRKFALLHHEGRWGRPLGSTPTTHIVKLGVEGFDDGDLNEYLCQGTAARLGLVAARSELHEFNDERVMITERYDREYIQDGLHRIHQEDLCQALGLRPDQKYQSDGGPTPQQILTLLRGLAPREAANASVTRFVDALIFNWLIVGTDAHTKNYSLLHFEGASVLAPLYDLMSILPDTGMHRTKYKLAMTIDREYRPSMIVGHNWKAFALDNGLDGDNVIARARELAQALPDAMQHVIATAEFTEIERTFSDVLLQRVDEHSALCLRALDK